MAITQDEGKILVKSLTSASESASSDDDVILVQTPSNIIKFPSHVVVTNQRSYRVNRTVSSGLSKAVGYWTGQSNTEAPKSAKLSKLTIEDLGWTREQAIAIRGLYGSIAEDWDDPSMDVYDDL